MYGGTILNLVRKETDIQADSRMNTVLLLQIIVAILCLEFKAIIFFKNRRISGGFFFFLATSLNVCYTVCLCYTFNTSEAVAFQRVGHCQHATQ